MSLAEPHTRQSPNRTFAVLGTGAMAYVLLQSLVVPALPTLQAALHTSQSTVSWIFTAYLLSASVATPVLGRLGDMFGKERDARRRARGALGRARWSRRSRARSA